MARTRTFGALCALLPVLVLSGTAHAATITVTTTADELTDNTVCSLREALTAANTDSNTHEDACTAGNVADTVSLGAGTYTLSIAGRGEDSNATGDLDVKNFDAAPSSEIADVTFLGQGDSATIIDA